MATSNKFPISVRDQIWQAADPTGEQRALVSVAGNPDTLDWLAAVGAGVGEAWRELGVLGDRYESQMGDIEDSLRTLVPRGWGIFNMKSDVVRNAVTLVDAGDGTAADELLAGQWEGEGVWRTKRVCDRVSAMGAAEPTYHDMFLKRAVLLHKAKMHHEADRYEASIPLIHAQMEGIVMDVTQGRKFFTKGRQKADVVDPSQLVSIEACLAALRTAYCDDIAQTQAAGSLSRHGVAHGRELAYDTRVNSAKNWSVLDALVEWAMPLARTEADRLRAARQSQRAESPDVDAEGRRIDDRQFAETANMLRVLQTSSMGWWGQRGRFRDDLVGGVYGTTDFVKRGLPVDHGTQVRVSADGQQTWFWRETQSGWVLGIGVAANKTGFMEWLYSAPKPPVGSPLDSPSEWGAAFETPPDWRS